MIATASILTRIRHLGDALPPTARRIATYIAEHPDEVIRMSITEVAEQTQASEGSIVGLCRRLGVSGFQELKILLSRDLVEPMRMIHEDLRPSDTVTDVAEHVFAAHIASLQETQKLLTQKPLARAVEILRAAPGRVESRCPVSGPGGGQGRAATSTSSASRSTAASGSSGAETRVYSPVDGGSSGAVIGSSAVTIQLDTVVPISLRTCAACRDESIHSRRPIGPR